MTYIAPKCIKYSLCSHTNVSCCECLRRKRFCDLDLSFKLARTRLNFYCVNARVYIFYRALTLLTHILSVCNLSGRRCQPTTATIVGLQYVGAERAVFVKCHQIELDSWRWINVYKFRSQKLQYWDLKLILRFKGGFCCDGVLRI